MKTQRVQVRPVPAMRAVVGSACFITAVLVLVFVLIDVVAGAGAGEEGEEVEVEELEEAKDPVAEAVEGSSCCFPLFPSLVFAGCLVLSARAPATVLDRLSRVFARS
jgi:hypothetical protein